MSQQTKQLILITHLFKLHWTNWPVDLGLSPDNLTTTPANARIGSLMAMAGGDHVRARRFLAQGGIEDQLDKVRTEFAALVAEYADLMETLPDPTNCKTWPPGWRPAHLPEPAWKTRPNGRFPLCAQH